jgi:hypothetical protein
MFRATLLSPIPQRNHELLAESRSHAVERCHGRIGVNEILEPTNCGATDPGFFMHIRKRQPLFLSLRPQQVCRTRKLDFSSSLLRLK